jgi:hypothetical protein
MKFKAAVLSRFKLTVPRAQMSRSMDREYEGVSIDDCARTCNEQVGVTCNSFDFSYLTGTCRLSKSAAPSINDNTEYDVDETYDIYNSTQPLLFYFI